MTPIGDINLKEKKTIISVDKQTKKTMEFWHKTWCWLIQTKYSRYDTGIITELVYFWWKQKT